ncbi:helix-turn-helix domain-containing protein [Methanonatronarchaeum sp. AMET-Sl]|uniref:helix-turn-helix domain-containing protein n=1 Tax=Methanonatronarchaeum sp. AMET-Sl TaxID=3037654 RepID=UPI00244DE178|nr:helix-turn-helix domain-containing protein [Methanonatronarchaeum sp. AMET-Sl]WGI16815.1 helix-turn-helix domain-containing protein [Methanonatronarchaeum sp. AMET-Sl]
MLDYNECRMRGSIGNGGIVKKRVIDRLAEKIAGEICLADHPSKTLKKWRKNFGITQTELAEELSISPSVISDYESGRRSSPGINIVKRLINGMISIDLEHGGKNVRSYGRILRSGLDFDAILDMNDYKSPVGFNSFCSQLGVEVVQKEEEDRDIHGHTVIDSVKAIVELNHGEFQQLYGWSTERALVFTRVSSGKSPLVAIRVTSLKPQMVVLHGIEPNEISPIALQIARAEGIPLGVSNIDIESVLERLSSIGG